MIDESPQVTVLPVMYRDAHNNKTHATYLALGAITKEQREALAAVLDADGSFIPEQVGLERIGDQSGWNFHDVEIDHAWHELDLEGIGVVTGRMPTVGVTADLVARIVSEAHGGWNATEYGTTAEAGYQARIFGRVKAAARYLAK